MLLLHVSEITSRKGILTLDKAKLIELPGFLQGRQAFEIPYPNRSPILPRVQSDSRHVLMDIIVSTMCLALLAGEVKNLHSKFLSLNKML